MKWRSGILNSRPGLPGSDCNGATNPRRVIGVLPGEGIGPEVIPRAVDVLRSSTRDLILPLEIRTYDGPIGAAAVRQCGKALTVEATEFCESIFSDNGVLLCGPGGGRFVYELRARFDLFCKLAPIRPLPVLSDVGVLQPRASRDVDILVVRENCGGMYFGTTHREVLPEGSGERLSHAYSYESGQVRRILEVAVRLAQARRGGLTLVAKPSGLPAMSSLWISLFNKAIAGAGLETRILEIDNACYQIVAAADTFDVVVAPNLFGDILADCAALLLGSRGMSYSGNLSVPRNAAAFQTGHGAAHDLAGKDVANPLGQILSAAMLLREGLGIPSGAALIESAVERTLAAGIRTADIASGNCSVVGTRQMGEAIIAELEQLAVPAPATM
jgi:3-isopropylmalate dehydrogenase